MRNEWEAEKQRILNTLIGSGQDLIDIAPETENLATEGVSMEGRSVMDSMEMAYARQVGTRHRLVIKYRSSKWVLTTVMQGRS